MIAHRRRGTKICLLVMHQSQYITAAVRAESCRIMPNWKSKGLLRNIAINLQLYPMVPNHLKQKPKQNTSLDSISSFSCPQALYSSLQPTLGREKIVHICYFPSFPKESASYCNAFFASTIPKFLSRWPK